MYNCLRNKFNLKFLCLNGSGRIMQPQGFPFFRNNSNFTIISKKLNAKNNDWIRWFYSFQHLNQAELSHLLNSSNQECTLSFLVTHTSNHEK